MTQDRPAQPFIGVSFGAVVLSGFLLLLTFGMTVPVLSRYTVEVLGGSRQDVGLVFAVFGVAAVVVRPLIGRIGDGRGRRALLRGGCAVMAVAMAGHLFATTLPVLFAFRFVAGVGQAAVLVAVTTLAADLAPSSRRGQAASYIMVALQLGMAVGPLIGEAIMKWGSFSHVWLTCVGLAVSCGFATLLVPSDVAGSAPIGTRKLLHRAGLVPGVVQGLGMLGYVGWLAFVPLYGARLGVAEVAPLYVLGALSMVAIRILGAGLPDRLGARRCARSALVLDVLGLTVMAVWNQAPGLYAGTVLMGLGLGLLFPSLMVLSLDAAEPAERAQAMSTFTLFTDVAGAVGPPVLGIVAGYASYEASFATGAVLAAVGAMVLSGRHLGARGPRAARQPG